MNNESSARWSRGRSFYVLSEFPLSRRKALAIAGYSLGISRLLPALDTSEAAPRFSGKSLDGESFNNQSLMGKVILVEFWATWCPYCRSDAGPLDDLAAEFEKDGLLVLAVNVGESKKKVKAFLAQNPRRAKVVLMQDTNLAAVFAARSFPQYVLINRAGRRRRTRARAGKPRFGGCCGKRTSNPEAAKTRRSSCGPRRARASKTIRRA